MKQIRPVALLVLLILLLASIVFATEQQPVSSLPKKLNRFSYLLQDSNDENNMVATTPQSVQQPIEQPSPLPQQSQTLPQQRGRFDDLIDYNNVATTTQPLTSLPQEADRFADLAQDANSPPTIDTLAREVQYLRSQVNMLIELTKALNDLDKAIDGDLVRTKKVIDALVGVVELQGQQIDMLANAVINKQDSNLPMPTGAKIPSVIESQIDGEFTGWEGETIFKLTNGQIWQQASYDYMYEYAYMPEVVIYKANGTYKMKVEDVEDTIEVKRIK